MNKRYKLGSNQYKKQRRNHGQYKRWLLYYGFGIAVLVGAPLFMRLFIVPQTAHAQTTASESGMIKQVIIAKKATKDMITPTPTDTPLQDKEIAYIKEVFGPYSDKALELLTSPICHENGELNPEATNYNTDDIHSIDRGLFQINNYWQKVDNVAFLYDYKINTQMAWNIFVHNGYTFNKWTCGRALGI